MILKSMLKVALLFAAVASLGAATDSPSIKCKIAGVLTEFPDNAKAVYDAKDGLAILGLGSDKKTKASIGIHIPVAKTGTFTLQDTSKLSLDYSKNVWSSDSGDHYDARAETKGALLKVTVTKFGKIGERVEGTFSALVNSTRRHVIITDGSFSVVLEERFDSPKK